MHVLLAAVLLLATPLALGGMDLVAGQKSVVSVPMRVEPRGGAVATLDELWANSTIVVEGAIEAERPADRVVGGIFDVRTTYEVRVIEVFKGAPRLNAATIPVRRRGGIRDRGDRIEHHVPVDYPLFKAGERYLLFLRQREWSRATPEPGLYYNETTSGPDSVFQVTPAPTLQTPGKSRLSRALAAQDAEAFRRRLRGMGDPQ
jgi:hypothetical protein